MIDRVAKAMFAHLVANDGPWSLAQGQPNSITLDGTFDLRDLARVAVLAMRESTEAMCDAANEAVFREGEPPSLPNIIWPAMIDAALKGEPSSK